MSVKLKFIFLTLIFIFVVAGCSSPADQVDVDATNAKIVEAVLATQAASVPSATNTLIPVPTATSTPTLIPTATFTPFPTQVPGKFNNSPSYLEKAFSEKWAWQTNAQGARIAAHWHSDFDTMGFLSYTAHEIVIGVLWDKDKEASEFVNSFYPVVLKNFVSPSTVEDIIQFAEANISNAPDTYTILIDGFAVRLVLSDDENIRNIMIVINEEQ